MRGGPGIQPRKKPTRTRLAYLAGLFDGEGCAGVWNITARGGQPTPIATVQMTDAEPVKAFQEAFGGYYHEGFPKHMQKPVYAWRVSHRKAEIVAKALLPFTLNGSKRMQWMKILEHYKKKT